MTFNIPQRTDISKESLTQIIRIRHHKYMSPKCLLLRIHRTMTPWHSLVQLDGRTLIILYFRKYILENILTIVLVRKKLIIISCKKSIRVLKYIQYYISEK